VRYSQRCSNEKWFLIPPVTQQRGKRPTACPYRPRRHLGERLLYAGDFFKRDREGYLYFLGRADDMIKTRGARVSPKGVPNALCAPEGVSEAVPTGVIVGAEPTFASAATLFTGLVWLSPVACVPGSTFGF
jgi:acyl-CoA synthetase (AMP-forming)/AMP-acid ligase II